MAKVRFGSDPTKPGKGGGYLGMRDLLRWVGGSFFEALRWYHEEVPQKYPIPPMREGGDYTYQMVSPITGNLLVVKIPAEDVFKIKRFIYQTNAPLALTLISYMASSNQLPETEPAYQAIHSQ